MYLPGRTRPKRARTWYERDGGKRLTRDRALIAASYSELVFSVDERKHRILLRGPIRLKEEETGVITSLLIQLVFPPDYPKREPRVFEIGGRFPRDIDDRHIGRDGAFCLWLPPESLWNPQDEAALRRLLDQVVVFCERQLTYEAIKRWPGGQWGHGNKGYAEYILETLSGNEALMDLIATRYAAAGLPGRNDACICDSQRKYKKCHERLLGDLMRKVGPTSFADGLSTWLKDRAALESMITPSPT